jgi:hypothetical protein
MWFWILLTTFFVIVFLVTRAVVRSQGGTHHVGLQQGYDVSLSGGSSTGGPWGGVGSAGPAGDGAGADGDGGGC